MSCERRSYFKFPFHCRQIAIDVPRMSPLVGLFQQRPVQVNTDLWLVVVITILLSDWLLWWQYWRVIGAGDGGADPLHLGHPPPCLRLRPGHQRPRHAFLDGFPPGRSRVWERQKGNILPQTLLQDFVDVDVTRNSFEFESLDETSRKNIEADSFWCMTKVLDGIQDNYTFAQPGIQVKIRQLEELLKRVDVKLHNHIVGHEVQYLQFSFRFVSPMWEVVNQITY